MSGWNAAQANQKWSWWTMRPSFVPSSGPATASPRMLHVLPVSSSTILSPPSLTNANVNFVPSTTGSNTPVAPTSLAEAMTLVSSAERAPGL